MSVTSAKKICLIGDFAVGKTSLVRRFVDNQFSDAYLSTIGVTISRKLLTLEGAAALQLVIWDLEGRGNFLGVADAYLQGASGAIIVGDVTRVETVKHIEHHISSFLVMNPTSIVVVALNKSDLMRESVPGNSLPFEKHKQLIHVQLTSAKSGSGVPTIFDTMGKGLLGI